MEEAACRRPVHHNRIGGPAYPAISLPKAAALTGPAALSLIQEKPKERWALVQVLTLLVVPATPPHRWTRAHEFPVDSFYEDLV
jgi:hypothetical protein